VRLEGWTTPRLPHIHGLTQDAVANLGVQSACGHEVYRSPQQMLKVALHFEEPEEPHWTGEVNEEIDVAVDSGLAPSRRSEESKGSDAKPGQIRSVPCQLRQYCLALVHGESCSPLLLGRQARHCIVGEDSRSGVAWLPAAREHPSYPNLCTWSAVQAWRKSRWELCWLPVLDKLRTLDELDPETVEILAP
jgi:hypothetical protein